MDILAYLLTLIIPNIEKFWCYKQSENINTQTQNIHKKNK